MKKNILKNQKLIFDFAVGLILCVAFLASVSAQSKVITKEEFETIRSKAALKLKQISYRAVTSQKIGKTELTTIYEFVPPNREHFITTIKSPEYLSQKLKIVPFRINKYEEWIYIGKKIYFRNAVNKKWEEILPDQFGGNSDGQGKGSGIGYGEVDRTFSVSPNKTIEYKLTPNQFINRQESDLFEVIETFKYSGSSELSVYNYKYWINKDGLFAGTQYNDSDKEETVSYEYTSNNKIEAPIIKKTKKKK